MKDFFLKHKNSIIIAAACLSVWAVVVIVFLFTGKKHITKPADNGSASKSASQSSSTAAIQSIIPAATENKTLVLSSPQKQTVTVTVPRIKFSGSSDPAFSLTLDGVAVERSADGSFAFDKDLSLGQNVFTFEHKGDKKVYKINYRYVIINGVYPPSNVSYNAGTTFSVTASARPSASVTANFNGKTITLKKSPNADPSAIESEFVNFNGEFTLPTGNEKNINLGKVTFNATLDGKTDSAASGSITCKRDTILDNITYVAEVVAFSAETFDGNTSDDDSRPTNSYLPEGTKDYCDRNVVVNSKTGKTYYKLRYGKRVYTDKKDTPNGNVTVTKRYAGMLPDHNELAVKSFTEDGRHSVLTLGTYWRAPFTAELKNQNYYNPAIQDYRISSTTYDYLEIKFFYATKFDGEITVSPDNPIFKSSELFFDGSNYILRLYLKERGKFYGWDCEYNQDGNLVFSFLHPAKIKYANNEYGADLTGVKVFLDVGHGGKDSGASAYIRYGYSEANRNLNLALKIKAELVSLGAEVMMVRNDDSTVSADTRCRMLKNYKPDICIAIHHDSNDASSPQGHATYYSTPFSFSAATIINHHIAQTGVYNKIWDLDWHYYYVARMTVCPVVLTENGFMSNQFDYNNNIANEEKNIIKAKAITRGIVDYLNTIQ